MSIYDTEQQEQLMEKTSIYSDPNYDLPSSLPRPSPLRTAVRYTAAFIAGTTLFTILLTLVNQSTSASTSEPINHAQYPEISQCGSTPSEARALRCTFDPIAAAWMPPACYNHTFFLALQREATQNLLSYSLNDAFVPYDTPDTFEWYTDSNLTTAIPQDELGDVVPFIGWTWERYHVAHCGYMWAQLLEATNRVLAGEKGVYVNSRALEEQHIKHCRMVLAEQQRRVGSLSKVLFGYGNCTKLS